MNRTDGSQTNRKIQPVNSKGPSGFFNHIIWWCSNNHVESAVGVGEVINSIHQNKQWMRQHKTIRELCESDLTGIMLHEVLKNILQKIVCQGKQEISFLILYYSLIVSYLKRHNKTAYQNHLMHLIRSACFTSGIFYPIQAQPRGIYIQKQSKNKQISSKELSVLLRHQRQKREIQEAIGKIHEQIDILDIKSLCALAQYQKNYIDIQKAMPVEDESCDEFEIDQSVENKQSKRPFDSIEEHKNNQLRKKMRKNEKQKILQTGTSAPRPAQIGLSQRLSIQHKINPQEYEN